MGGAVGAPDAEPGTRLLALDHIKVLAIAAIIAAHGVMGYAESVFAWAYAGVNEVSLAPVTEAVMLAAVAPFALIVIPLLFLAAGLVAPIALERHGTRHFVVGRLIRLGVPFVAFVFLLQPVQQWTLGQAVGEPTGPVWGEILGGQGNLRTGPLWFVGVLLIFSLAYAALLSRHPVGPPVRAVTGRTVAALVPIVIVLSFVIRLRYPYGGDSGFFNLNIWKWPVLVAVFAIGIRGARQGWLTTVPAQLENRCRAATLAAAALMAGGVIVVGDLAEVESVLGGWGLRPLAFTALESTLSLCGAVWFLALTQRWLRRPWPADEEVGRCAYGAYVLQGIPLLTFAILLRDVPAAAEVKAVVVAVLGTVGSFALAWVLRRIPGVGRVL